MSTMNIASIAAPTTVLAVTTTSGTAPVQLAITSDFLELKNGGTVPVFIRLGRTAATTIATATWVNPTSASSDQTMTPILPGEISIYRHSSRGATDVTPGGLWIAAVAATGTATLYATPVEGR